MARKKMMTQCKNCRKVYPRGAMEHLQDDLCSDYCLKQYNEKQKAKLALKQQSIITES